MEKRRRRIAYGAAMVEVDEYEGDLPGSSSPRWSSTTRLHRRRSRRRRWFGAEVTEDDRYKNRALAVDGRPA